MFVSVSLLAMIAGCASAPLERSAPVAPAAFSTSAAAEEAQLALWWRAFDDPQLTQLIDRALADNPDMAIAQARIAQARAEARVAQAALGPSLNLGAGATTTQLSENALPPGLTRLTGGDGGNSGGLGLPGEAFTTYQTGFDAAWELDLFGLRRAGQGAARARAEAAVWTARDARVRLSAEVARTYFQYGALKRRLAVADEILAAHGTMLAASEARARHGLIDARDTGRRTAARDQAAAARALLAAEAQARLHALAALTGQPPLALMVATTATAPDAPQIPAGLPADLLRRRPDLRAAELRLAAADADAAAARADLYPKLTLSGTAQLASIALSSLLSADSLQATGAVRASLPLLDGGRRRATLAGRRAAADEADAAWRGQLLTALKETEDALSRLEADAMRRERLASAATAAEKVAQASRTREANGLIGATESLEARLAALQAHDAEIQAQAQQAEDTTALVKALGGGWEAER
ncbi:efflux transporter outer membrane subunit [Phenylobacterium immobile]|uniref:efflux transporter outer membrane subunit n=1 Tax=Phenylobacterium immobile TaxID=21 RepID=UPI000A52C74E|nr:efflux transporter outer membrane subunit [Phenylobacterium immobile]